MFRNELSQSKAFKDFYEERNSFYYLHNVTSKQEELLKEKNSTANSITRHLLTASACPQGPKPKPFIEDQCLLDVAGLIKKVIPCQK